MRLVQIAVPITVVLACVVVPGAAHAQVAFPSETAWVPLRCARAPMTDPFADQAGAIDERDLVGAAASPAGLRAGDTNNLYLRLRLEEDPAPAGQVRPYSWGMQFDLDRDLMTYEVMVLVDGIGGPAGTVSLLRNTATTVRNDPSDPADQPAAATYPFAMNARTLVAPGSTYGDNADYFLDIAVPWPALRPLGLDRDTITQVWAATSSVATGFNGDLACHDGTGGPARLDGAASDETTGDPTMDPNGGGGGGTGRLEGGGGCTAGRAGTSSAVPAFVLLLLALTRRRRRRP